MSYKTIKKHGTGEFEEKKSIFTGNVKRVSSEEEARDFIESMRNKYKEARHNVYAYIIGENKGIQRYSDDGEPQGTGGIPVLEVIKKNDITDCVVVVTRYFGGILLGTGGLTRAYTKGASLAIKDAGIVEKVEGTHIKVVIDYELLGKVQYICGQNKWHIENIEYTDKVCIEMIKENSMLSEIEEQLKDVTNGNVEFSKVREGVFFKEGFRLYEEI